MVRQDLQIRLIRNRISHDYQFDKSKSSFDSNIKNNSKDIIIIVKNNTPIFKSFCQSVANHPHYKYKDTIHDGKFEIKCFVENRNFHGGIHGIINAFDIEGQPIDIYSMQIDNGYQKGRWLIHDKYSFEKKRDLNNAYSGGCFIMSSEQLSEFNKVLISCNVNPGDVIPGILMEV